MWGIGKKTLNAKKFLTGIEDIGLTQEGLKQMTKLAKGKSIEIGNKKITQSALYDFSRNGITDMDVAKEIGFVGADGEFNEKAFNAFKTALRGNTSIVGNVADFGKNHQTLGSAVNFINEYRKGENVTQAAKNVFLKDPTGKLDTDNIHYARGMAAIGSGMIAARAGIGAINGVTTDSAGNADIAGIPFF